MGVRKKRVKGTEVASLILKRRLQCLIHRYLYYVLSQSIISDQKYDEFEKDLRRLIAENPEVEKSVRYAEICPSRHVGSSLDDDYPRDIEQLAKSVLAYHQRITTTDRTPNSDGVRDLGSSDERGSLPHGSGDEDHVPSDPPGTEDAGDRVSQEINAGSASHSHGDGF